MFFCNLKYIYHFCTHSFFRVLYHRVYAPFGYSPFMAPLVYIEDNKSGFGFVLVLTGHRIQSGLVPAIQKSRLRLLGRALDPGVENVYTWLRGGVLNGEADLDQRWLDGTVEHESMGTRHDNRALAARLADFLQVAYRQYQSTLWKYHRDRLVEVG
ncbi:hypothetical protein BASA61_000699 [Batrachochytrium salamandrivorans]|nr:hypothetical protein BASA61_000699 [Batrachochytrium salamandrivorans]